MCKSSLLPILREPVDRRADFPSRYMQFHPLAYIVKLRIEMSMADLIAKIAKSKNNQHSTDKYFRSRPTGLMEILRPTVALRSNIEGIGDTRLGQKSHPHQSPRDSNSVIDLVSPVSPFMVHFCKT